MIIIDPPKISLDRNLKFIGLKHSLESTDLDAGLSDARSVICEAIDSS